MRPVVLIDGESVGPLGPHVSVHDRGFLYGDSVFEVLRTYGGVASFLREHVRRLLTGCARLEIASGETAAGLTLEVERALSLAELRGGEDATVRLVVTRGEGPGLDLPGAPRASRFVVVSELTVDETALSRGVDAALLPRQSAMPEGVKTGSYVPNVLARRAARRLGAGEAILLDGRSLVEGAGSNVFAVAGRRLFTAPETLGVLAGITRAHVIELAQASGLAVELRAPTLDDPLDELFCTSSLRGIVPVRRLVRADEVVFEATSWPEATRLRGAFLARAMALASRASPP